MTRRILYVSKAMIPPWNDGSKCLVRDIATHLRGSQPILMTTPQGSTADLAACEQAAVYVGRGGFAPSVTDNARVVWHLLKERRASLWHFVMAPNPRTGKVARALRSLRRVPVVQTIASPPRSFTGLSTLLFGDVIVAQSRATADKLTAQAEAEHFPLKLEVIPPPVGEVALPSTERIMKVRAQLELPAGPVFVYPGDLEVSQGAETVARLVELTRESHPDAVFVFACREKTPKARLIRDQLQARLGSERARFAGDMPDFLALLATATAILFPVDDLWGKVDLPIALLEAMTFNVPVLALAQGPLRDLEGGAHMIASLDPDAWHAALTRLVKEPAWAAECGRTGSKFVLERHSASVIATAYQRIYETLVPG